MKVQDTVSLWITKEILRSDDFFPSVSEWLAYLENNNWHLYTNNTYIIFLERRVLGASIVKYFKSLPLKLPSAMFSYSALIKSMWILLPFHVLSISRGQGRKGGRSCITMWAGGCALAEWDKFKSSIFVKFKSWQCDWNNLPAYQQQIQCSWVGEGSQRRQYCLNSALK